MRKRSTDGRGERQRAVLAEPLARFRLEQVATVDAEEMVRLVDLHQAGGTQSVTERQEAADGVRPALRHPLRRAVPAEPEGEQEGQLDAGKGVGPRRRRRR